MHKIKRHMYCVCEAFGSKHYRLELFLDVMVVLVLGSGLVFGKLILFVNSIDKARPSMVFLILKRYIQIWCSFDWLT